MKKSKTFLVCAMLSGSVLFSSCIGSFGLWNSLKDWNQGVSNNCLSGGCIGFKFHRILERL